MADTLHTVPTKPLTKEDRIELGRKAVAINKGEGKPVTQIAREMGISDKTLGYYITVYKKSLRTKKEEMADSLLYPVMRSEKTSLVKVPNEELDKLRSENTDLKEKNAELQRSVKALQNVILILGHQHSEDD
ncbi:hypothetical protein HYP99_gp019 [Sinorhizobium phage ort11]|uniref:Transposase n=1 Tax=Sinorhizobium phage ort11 TaxID=2599764 RepID=A0A5C2H189_9CAUD|nr:hypothetical protein HYP99_gp019 [Sinorhizobium phage ort11]QEP29817.1 hypothetical protein Smphiort11_019 [Sinorhizobium phage ort11]